MFYSPACVYKSSFSPNDTVSEIVMHSMYDIFAATSWDSSIYYYDTNNAVSHRSTTQLSNPLLSGCFYDNNKMAAGSVNGMLYVVDVASGQVSEIKAHEAGIRKIRVFNNILITASWDKKLKFWDMRSDTPVYTHDLLHKVYSMDIKNDNLVVALSNNTIVALSINDLQHQRILHTKLKWQLRALCCTNNNQVVVGGIEGAIDIINMNDTPDYMFKSHRSMSTVYAINCIDVHPLNTFLIASGGSDAYVMVYHKQQRSKLYFEKSNAPVTAGKFSRNGMFYIYSTGEDWSRGYPASQYETNVYALDLKKAKVPV